MKASVQKLLTCRHPKTCVSKVAHQATVVERCSCCGSVRHTVAHQRRGRWERPLYVQILAEVMAHPGCKDCRHSDPADKIPACEVCGHSIEEHGNSRTGACDECKCICFEPEFT